MRVLSMHFIDRSRSCLLRTRKETSLRSQYLPVLCVILSLCSNVQSSSYMIDLVATETKFFISIFISSYHVVLLTVAMDLQPIPGT